MKKFLRVSKAIEVSMNILYLWFMTNAIGMLLVFKYVEFITIPESVDRILTASMIAFAICVIPGIIAIKIMKQYVLKHYPEDMPTYIAVDFAEGLYGNAFSAYKYHLRREAERKSKEEGCVVD